MQGACQVRDHEWSGAMSGARVAFGEVDCDDILCKGMVPGWMGLVRRPCAVCGVVEASCVMERLGYYAHVYCRLVVCYSVPKTVGPT